MKRGTNKKQALIDPNVRAIRNQLSMSVTEFARAYHIPAMMLRQWEDGSKRMSPTAKTYLRLITKQPKMVCEALKS